MEISNALTKHRPSKNFSGIKEQVYFIGDTENICYSRIQDTRKNLILNIQKDGDIFQKINSSQAVTVNDTRALDFQIFESVIPIDNDIALLINL